MYRIAYKHTPQDGAAYPLTTTRYDTLTDAINDLDTSIDMLDMMASILDVSPRAHVQISKDGRIVWGTNMADLDKAISNWRWRHT
jgi:hypothetical protein